MPCSNAEQSICRYRVHFLRADFIDFPGSGTARILGHGWKKHCAIFSKYQPLSSLTGSEKLMRVAEDKSLHGLVGVDAAPFIHPERIINNFSSCYTYKVATKLVIDLTKFMIHQVVRQEYRI